MRRLWIGLVLSISIVLAVGCDSDDVGDDNPNVPDANVNPDEPDADVTPPFTPSSGLYELLTQNFPENADPSGCSLAPGGAPTDPTLVSVTAGSDTLTLSLFGQTTVCVRSGMDFTCPTQVNIRFANNAEIRDFTTLAGAFTDEDNWVSDNIREIECIGTGCTQQESASGVTEFPCTFPAMSTATFSRP